jgi:uncharacterized membrane protein (UPF0127 family)
MKLYEVSSQRLILSDLEVTASSRSRTRGLIGHPVLDMRQGLVIRPCSWIHTFGMGFAIDVLYVGRDGRIVACAENLRPGRIDRPVLRSRWVVEMAAGGVRHHGLKVGDVLEVRD